MKGWDALLKGAGGTQSETQALLVDWTSPLVCLPIYTLKVGSLSVYVCLT